MTLTYHSLNLVFSLNNANNANDTEQYSIESLARERRLSATLIEFIVEKKVANKKRP